VFTRSRKWALAGLVALSAVLLTAGTGEPAGGKKKAKKRLRKEVILQLREGEVFAPEAFEEIPIVRRKGSGTDLLAIKLPKRLRNSDAARRLVRLIRARKIEHTRPTRLLEGKQSTVPAIGDDFTKRTFLDQAAFQVVGRPAAHRHATGDGVVVAVLDSGLLEGHEIFAGRVLPGLDLVDGDRDPAEVRNGIDDDGDGRIDEGYGHGTFVAGLIAGMAPDARILPIRVLSDEGAGDSFALADGIYHAVRSGADVICLSLGMNGHSPLVRSATGYAENKGVVVVCAAVLVPGSGTALQKPGGFPTVLTVTAFDLADRKPAWATDHPKVDIAAPGVDIVGPWPGGDGRTYARGSGTSFSTAIVAGAVALVLDAAADLDPGEVRQVLIGAAADVSDLTPGTPERPGAGRLDLREVFP